MTGSIPIMLQYNGKWSEQNKYENFEVHGILIPSGCSYDELLYIINNNLSGRNTYKMLEIKYSIEDGYSPLIIKDDISMLFYLELKTKESCFKSYPMCITEMDKCETGESYKITLDNLGIIDVETETTNFCVEQEQEIVNSNDDFIDMIDYVGLVCRQTVESLNNKVEEVEEDEQIMSNPMLSAIEAGKLFKDKDILKTAFNFYAVKNDFQFKVYRSCERRYDVNCLDEACPWQLRASRKGNTKMFKIRKFIATHSCDLRSRLSSKRQATSNVIAFLIKSKFVDVKTVYTPADIIRDMRDEYGVNIKYMKAWRSMEKAMDSIRGKPSESYSLLPKYLYMLKNTNPGSAIHLETQHDLLFLYLFIAVDASIIGWKYCMPIIVVDGTFLKATHGGTLITASTQDAAGKIFLLAFCIVDSENDSSWEWFFGKFRLTFGTRDKMCIISDRHESIHTAATKVYPGVPHCICVYHLLNNVKTRFKKNSKKIKNLLFKTAEEYTIEQFDYYMAEIKKVDSRITDYLWMVGYEKWSRVHSINNRYSTMTFNIAESLNSAIKAARNIPITGLVEYLRNLVQEWTYANRNIAMSTFTKLTKRYEDRLKENYISSMRMKVIPSNNDIFSVLVQEKTFNVDFKERTCTCNKFQMDELPCAHALAVINDKHMDCYEYCSNYYTKETMLATYEGVVHPIPSQMYWNTPNNVEEELVLPPIGKHKLGRPKKRRIRAGWESNIKIRCIKIRCSRCGKHRHNRKTCRGIPKK